MAVLTGEEVRQFTACKPHPVRVTQWVQEFRTKEGRMVCGCHEPTERYLVLYDYVNDKQVYQKEWSLNDYNDARVSPDGGRALSWRNDFSVVLWDVHTGKELRRFFGHQDEILGMWWMPGGKQFVSAGRDETVVWDAGAEKRESGRLNSLEEGAVGAVAFSPDGARMAVGAGGKVPLLDVKTLKSVHEIPRLVDPSYKHLRDGLFETPEGRTFWSDRADIDANVKQLRFFPDGRRLAVGAGNGIIVVFDSQTGQELARRQEQVKETVEVTAMDVSPDGRRILYSTTSSTIRLWDWEADNVLCELRGHVRRLPPEHAGKSGGVNALAFTSDGKHALSGGEDGTIRMWRLPD